jgi:hypothetical protein
MENRRWQMRGGGYFVLGRICTVRDWTVAQKSAMFRKVGNAGNLRSGGEAREKKILRWRQDRVKVEEGGFAMSVV